MYFQNQFENNFNQEIEDVIEDLFGESASDAQKEELNSKLIYILRKHSENHQTHLRYQYDENNFPYFSNNLQNFSNLTPCINIFLISPTNTSTQQFYSNYQPQISPNAVPNLYHYPIIQQPQFIQPPFALYYNQQPISVTNKKSESNSVHKKHHKKDKSKSKSGKSDQKSKKKSNSDQKGSEIITLAYEAGNDFKGIFNYLTGKTGGNIHDNGTIEVTSNNIKKGIGKNGKEYPPKNVLSTNPKEEYVASGGNDAWICFDFKKMAVEVNKYTIKNSSFGARMKNWVLETSNNGEKWTEIDRRSDYVFSSGSSSVMSFDAKPKKFARYCRLRHDGQTSDSGLCLVITTVELYGKLKL